MFKVHAIILHRNASNFDPSTVLKGFRLIATDGIFSMDGDVAPLKDICDLADKYDAWVFVGSLHRPGAFKCSFSPTISFGAQDI